MRWIIHDQERGEGDEQNIFIEKMEKKLEEVGSRRERFAKRSADQLQ
jgi:hypothetical protein